MTVKSNLGIIRFPIIEKIHVDGYQLYPGNPSGSGLKYEVKPGVNIVVGVNGLGKTTLLNLMLRMLAGPFHIPAEQGIGMGRRATVPVNRRYFATRAMDGASTATAEVLISFDGKEIRAKRKLGNLSLVEIEIDQVKIVGTPDKLEDHYQMEVLRLSGLKQFYDFVLLLQFVFFFLEDRQALIWDQEAQAEVLRTLYYDQDSQIEYTQLFNSIAQLDSDIRNTNAVITRHKKRVQNAVIKSLDSNIAKSLKEVQSDLKELGTMQDKREEEIEELSKGRDIVRTNLEKVKIARDQKQTKLTQLNERMLSKMFGEAEHRMLHSLASIVGERGCTICGSKDAAAKQRVLSIIQNHHCPLCGSNDVVREYAEKSSTDSDEILQEIRDIESDLVELDRSEGKLSNELLALNAQYEQLFNDVVQIRANYEQLRINEKVLASNAPKSDEDIDKLQEQLQGFVGVVDELQKEKEASEKRLEQIISKGEELVSSVAAGIVQRFDEYIKGFMAEQCSLQYKVREEKIGQGISSVKFRFPVFSVVVTSGVYVEQGTIRLHVNDVSESQREFIDLAFRMSVMAEISSQCPALLVVETPEASLDSVFVPRAGRMIKRFLSVHGGHENRLIASTNLNKEAMIPALFDVISEQEAIEFVEKDDREGFAARVSEAVRLENRQDCIINLLSIAAQNAALRKFMPEYRQVYDEAISPPWEDFDKVKVGKGRKHAESR